MEVHSFRGSPPQKTISKKPAMMCPVSEHWPFLGDGTILAGLGRKNVHNVQESNPSPSPSALEGEGANGGGGGGRLAARKAPHCPLARQWRVVVGVVLVVLVVVVVVVGCSNSNSRSSNRSNRKRFYSR